MNHKTASTPPHKKRSSILVGIPENRTFDMDDSITGSSSSIPEMSSLEESSSSEECNSSRLLHRLSRKWTRTTHSERQHYGVAALRGIHGSDFEGYAVVCLANSKRSIISRGGDPKERYLLIKGAFCFVFKEANSPYPKYVIRLSLTKTRVATVTKHMTTTVMETTTSRGYTLEHKFCFLREPHAKQFCATANRMATMESAEMRQKLGEEPLLYQSDSIRYAERVAMETMDVEKTQNVLRGKRMTSERNNEILWA